MKRKIPFFPPSKGCTEEKKCQRRMEEKERKRKFTRLERLGSQEFKRDERLGKQGFLGGQAEEERKLKRDEFKRRRLHELTTPQYERTGKGISKHGDETYDYEDINPYSAYNPDLDVGTFDDDDFDFLSR